MKTIQNLKLPRAVNEKTQKVIDYFFSEYDAEEVNETLIGTLLMATIERKGYGRAQIKYNTRVVNDLVKLITALDLNLNSWKTVVDNSFSGKQPCMN